MSASADGRFVAFFSDASNLVSGDTNGVRDVFLRDRNTGVTERISVNSSGQQGNAASQADGRGPAVSANGGVVAFASNASNLVAGDGNGQTDVFVRVRGTNTTERVSVGSIGQEANGPSLGASVSADGRFVAFQSLASNLVPGDSNGGADVFVRDRVLGTTELACGIQGDKFSYAPSISGDGNVVAFVSAATNLVPGDTNGVLDIYVCNRATGVVRRVSVANDGTQGDGDSIVPALSGDGRVVAFKSLADNLVPSDLNQVVDVFAFDLAANAVERISVSVTGGNADDFSFPPSISETGRYVAFGSAGTNLVFGDVNGVWDVFVRDRNNAFTVLVSVNAAGEQANGGTPDAPPAVSGDGKVVAFVSSATNLVGGDRNENPDVFSATNPFFGPNGCPDDVCPNPGDVCVQGFCMAATPTAPPTRTGTPTRTPTITSTPTPTPTFRACDSDSDCPDGEHCRAGYCKKERPCDDSDPAVDRHACFDREACVGNLCECGGDCNLNGVVLVDEITKALLILGGARPVSQCLAADIDGNGQVMGNEITLAVLNQSKGCVQEGQPLLFARDRGGLVTFGIAATTSAAGDSATVSVDLTGGGGEVATAQLDLLLDPSVFDIGVPTASCHKDERLKDQVFLATAPTLPPTAGGLQRVRLLVADISDPVATFADGPIVTCTFAIKTGVAAGDVALVADRLNVGDARGDVFGVQALSGVVSVQLPTAVPSPAETPRPACAGDCDGDGEVLANELTQAVRVLAGQLELSECPAADADGDGEVFVTDLTRAVVNAGEGCPVE